MSFLVYLLMLVLWERWYMGRLTFEPWRRLRLRTRARHAIALNPAAFDARVDLARDALARGRHREACGLLEPILARADDAAEVPRLYGQALLGSGRAQEAADAFSNALRLDRKEREAQLGLAQAFFALGRWAEARREIEAYRVGRPGDARGSWAEAAIRLRDGADVESSLAALGELIHEQRLKPGYARRRDRRWAVRARLALLVRQPPARAWL